MLTDYQDLVDRHLAVLSLEEEVRQMERFCLQLQLEGKGMSGLAGHLQTLRKCCADARLDRKQRQALQGALQRMTDAAEQDLQDRAQLTSEVFRQLSGSPFLKALGDHSLNR